MDVCEKRRLRPKRDEKHQVPRGVSESHVLGDLTADAGEPGDENNEGDIWIDLVNPVRDLEMVVHED